jgi:hypothetical protein
VCKQKAYQSRQVHKDVAGRRAQLCAIYPDWGQETIGLLDGFAAVKNQEMVECIAAAITAEVERGTQQLSGKVERQRARIDKQNWQHQNRANELEEARADLLRLRQERAREQEEIHDLSELAQAQQMHLRAGRERITNLETEGVQQERMMREQAETGRDQVQQRFKEYVSMTNERLSQLSGELAQLRQERERAARPVMLGDLLFELGRKLGYPELWFESPEWKEQAKVMKGREYWHRFCERAAAWEVKAAYEAAQRVESNR